MAIKEMRIKETVGPVWILLFIASYTIANPLRCPEGCICSEEGTYFPFARCYGLLPQPSSFGFSPQNLEISDALDIPQFSLKPSYFKNSKFRTLVTVKLHNTSLLSVEEKTFEGFPELHDIDLSDNPFLKEFHPNAVAGARELHILSFSGSANLYTSMSGPIFYSDSLSELDLSRCGIENLHLDAFSRLPALTYINLEDNKISIIPSGIFDFVLSLEDLNLAGNFINSLPKDMLKKNDEMSTINFRGNPISEVNRNIFDEHEPPMLDLDVSGTNMTSLAIPDLPELVQLKINGSNISSFGNLRKFISLTHLNASETNIASIESDTFSGNPYLETLLLSGNKNIKLPKTLLENFQFLHLVDLSYCELKDMPLELFFQMRQIATLNLSHNALSDATSLGKVLSPLQNLRILDLSYNKLRVIEIGDFNNRGLRSLILSGNPLISPPSLEDFPLLRRLDLSHCSFNRLHLPELFSQGSNLQQLSLAGDKLCSLFDQSFLSEDEDESIWNPPQHLNILDLTGNPWACDPAFTSLLYEMIRLGVAPSEKAPPDMVRPGFPRDLDAEWRLLEMQACEDESEEIEVLHNTVEPQIIENEFLVAQIVVWVILGVLILICGAAMLVLFKTFGFHKKSNMNIKTSVPHDPVKAVSLVVPTAPAKKVKVKSYQRLHEDRSPGSPTTPRIYRPPPGTKFPYPDLDIKDIDESCDEEDNETTNLEEEAAQPKQ